jgi:hypothetical protein
MFAVRFDDLKRKMLKQDKPVLLNKLTTAMSGSPEFEVYMGLFLMPENTAIHVEVEEDNKTYTFFTIITDEHLIELAKKRKEEEYDRNRSAVSSGAFV